MKIVLRGTTGFTARLSLMWFGLICNVAIKKVWEVYPLKCSKCKGEMKIISFINEQSVIRKILEHLNLWNREEQRATPVRNRPVM